jgi:hypothetical protein
MPRKEKPRLAGQGENGANPNHSQVDICHKPTDRESPNSSDLRSAQHIVKLAGKITVIPKIRLCCGAPTLVDIAFAPERTRFEEAAR